ncbi:hypothetical protein BLS_010108 [Venturia inaequalis]|uniref:Uncharacterized protein n=1 Tax=Venturia inaequalis TaxID=5025 RepID=A0A8H3U3U3_VENIN|nr:hypothetical protein BLS_010108 [Venturia inaequalis]KAE9989857.1 hypothetical protein EG327_002159 [Venturia inaequalis]
MSSLPSPDLIDSVEKAPQKCNQRNPNFAINTALYSSSSFDSLDYLKCFIKALLGLIADFSLLLEKASAAVKDPELTILFGAQTAEERD